MTADAACKYETAYLRGPKRRRTNGSEPNNVFYESNRGGTANTHDQHAAIVALAAPSSFNVQSPNESLSGDASARGFLTRVYGHLSAAGHAMPRYLSRPADRMLPDDSSDPTIVLPDRSTTMSYLECFAEHAQVTYRYVPRRQWSSLVTRLYDDDESLLVDDASIALLLLVIGLG